MYKKVVIFGLVLFLAGTAAFGWVLAEQRKTARLLQKQQEAAKASWDKLDKVVAGQTDVYPSADVVSDEQLQAELEKHRMRKERVELVLTASIMCMLTGGTIFTSWLLLCAGRLLVSGLPRLKRFPADYLRRRKMTKVRHLAKALKEKQEVSEQQEQPYEAESQSLRELDENRTDELETVSVIDDQLSQTEEPLQVQDKSGQMNFETSSTNDSGQTESQAAISMENKPQFNASARDAKKIAVLLSDEESIEPEEPLQVATENPDLDAKPYDRLAQDIRKTVLSDYHENSAKLEDSIKAQTENLEKQVAEFRQMTQAVQQNAIEHSRPLNSTLKDLTEQVAAIREYASQQQDRVTKFQDGYDWNIIRSFCLRVVRCIDNLENRINRLQKQSIETTDVEEVRDELIFALESSGVEQFQPEINSDYRGQEKNAETVKDKEYSDDPTLSGKIAKVIKPGYRYVIGEENVKVVRPAQVKLFA